MKKQRCWWCGEDPLYVMYHDEEWGVPVRDDDKLFEFLTLETFQAGLSWITILRKRENFRKAFDAFNYKKNLGVLATIFGVLQKAYRSKIHLKARKKFQQTLR